MSSPVREQPFQAAQHESRTRVPLRDRLIHPRPDCWRLTKEGMLSGTHRNSLQEQVIYGRPALEALTDLAKAFGAHRLMITSTASLAGPGGLAQHLAKDYGAGSEATVELAEYGHRCRMRTGHLDGECSFDFIFRLGARDHREGGIHGCFRNCAKRRTRRSLNLEQRGVHEIARHRAEGFVQQ